MNAQPPDFKAGYVAIMGRPNVGKSTLLNAFMGQKIAAVSHRPQTTRRRQLGILTLSDAQVVFIDTPGMHKPVHKLGEFMNEEAQAALTDADVIVFLVDASQPISEEDRFLAASINQLNPKIPVILALNKIDLFPSSDLATRQAEFQELVSKAIPQPLSGVVRSPDC